MFSYKLVESTTIKSLLVIISISLHKLLPTKHVSLLLQKNESIKEVSKNILADKTTTKGKRLLIEKSVQTDIQNIQSQLIVSRILRRGMLTFSFFMLSKCTKNNI